jgi:hypothetical protein
VRTTQTNALEIVCILSPPCCQGAEQSIALCKEDVNRDFIRLAFDSASPCNIPPQKCFSRVVSLLFRQDDSALLFAEMGLILQHDVAPVVRLILSIAPTGRRIHRIGGLDVDRPVKHGFAAKPADFVQSPADQQQGAGPRQVIFPTSHLSPPCPIKFAAFAGWRCQRELDALRKREKSVPSLFCQCSLVETTLINTAIGGPLYDISLLIATGFICFAASGV